MRTSIFVIFVAQLLLSSYITPDQNYVEIKCWNITGFNRSYEPACFGVPLPPRLLYSTDSVLLRNSTGAEVPIQVKPVCFWPDGSIRWILIDCQASAPSHGCSSYRLEYGVEHESYEGELELYENGEILAVFTGILNLTVSKDEGLIKVYMDLDGDGVAEYPAVEKAYFMVEDTSGLRYYSTCGVKNVCLEEYGPLKAVVRINGTYKTPGGAKILNYTVRIELYSGKCYFRVYHREENGWTVLNDGSGQPDCLRLDSPNTISFEDSSLVIVSGQSYEMFAAAVNGFYDFNNFSSKILLYQDSSGGEDWDRWPGVSFRGYRFWLDGTLAWEGNRSPGWIALMNDYYGLAVGVRYFWENYPKALESYSNGTIYVRLMPRYFSEPFRHRAGEHKTHEILVYLYPPSESSQEIVRIMRCLMNPLYMRASSTWYVESGVLDYWASYNPKKYYYYETNNLAAIRNGTGGYYGNNLFQIRENVDFYGWMHFGDVRIVDEDGGTGQMNLQYDFSFGMIAQSLRLFDSAVDYSYRWWLLAEQGARHVSDIDILHVHWGDPEHPSSYWIQWCWGGMFWHTPHGQPGLDNPHRGSSPHLSFQYNRGLLYYYYLSGYKFAEEAAMEVAENTYWRVVHGNGNPGYSGTMGDDLRAPANALDILVNAYYHTLDVRFLEAAYRVVNESHFNYRWFRDGPNPQYSDRSVMPWQIAMLMVSIGRYLDLLRLMDYNIDRMAAESLKGYADWILKYCYQREPNEASSYPHFIYRWWGDGTREDWSPGAATNAWQVKIADALAYAWIYTGNETYIEIAEEQFMVGSMYFWFEGNPTGVFATGKNHAVLATSGNVYTSARLVPIPIQVYEDRLLLLAGLIVVLLIAWIGRRATVSTS